MRYYEIFAASPSSQPYFSGFLIIAVAFRFYFALKATRVFGPFTKLIKINAVSLVEGAVGAVRFTHLGNSWAG